MIWAVVGESRLALTAYEWISWILNGHAKPSPVGATDPDWLQVSFVI